MGKSIEEILAKMQAEQKLIKESQQAEEMRLLQLREKQRQEWLRRNRIYEAQVSTAAASSAAGAGAGAGGGKGAKPTFKISGGNSDLDNYSIYNLSFSGELTPDPVDPILDSWTVLGIDPNNKDWIYYVYSNYDTVSNFGRYNQFTGEKQDITDLSSYTVNFPSSLDWDGEKFIYIDSLPLIASYTQSSIFSISTTGEVNFLCNTEGGRINSIFIKDGITYCSYTDGVLASIGTIDLETGVFTGIENPYLKQEGLPDESVSTKVWSIWDVREFRGKYYCLVLYNIKDPFTGTYQCIGELNIDTGEITFLIDLGPIGDLLWTSIVII